MRRLALDYHWGLTDHHWKRAGEILIDLGELEPVAELAVLALGRKDGGHGHAWDVLVRVAELSPEKAWAAVARVLERRDPLAGKVLLAFQFARRTVRLPPTDVLAWVGEDEQRARMVAGLIRPYGETLAPLLRALILRFGAHGSVAEVIENRLLSPDGAVSSLAEHDATQLAHARGWLDDPEPVVRRFAQRLVESLERSHDEHSAWEEAEQLAVSGDRTPEQATSPHIL